MNQVNTPFSPFFQIHFILRSLFGGGKVAYESTWLSVRVNPLSSLGNGSVNTFPAVMNTQR
jgi:hypothetical protein